MSVEKPFGMPELPGGWYWDYFESLCKRVSVGHVGETSSFFTDKVNGIPFIRSQNVRPGRLDLEDIKYVTNDFHEKSKKSQLKAGDILIVRVGQNRGDCCVLPPDMGEYNCANIVFGRPANKKYSNYLGYFFNSVLGREALLAVSSGSAQGVLNTKAVAKVIVPVPPVDIADDIGCVLNSFDAKISVNQQINQTLEQMAQAIFKSWFVDFEPVKAKIAVLEAGGSDEDALIAAMQAISGKDADQLATMKGDQPEQYAELRATAELFPSAMQESELGEIPEGWNVELSGQCIDVRDGTHDSPKKSDSGHPLITSKHITTGVLDLASAYLISSEDFEKVNKRSKVQTNDILLTMIGTVGIPYLVTEKKVDFAIKNVGLFRTSEVPNLDKFFYLLLKSNSMKDYLDARMAGTTQKYLSLKVLRNIEFVMPSSGLLNVFSRKLEPAFKKIFNNQEEARSLSNLRDILLPKLLSGQILVEDIESSVKASVHV